MKKHILTNQSNLELERNRSQRLKEFSLDVKEQKLKPTIEDGNIILGIICEEVEG